VHSHVLLINLLRVAVRDFLEIGVGLILTEFEARVEETLRQRYQFTILVS